jgi:alpha-tubulin suppressor-like RCC1 family protein
VQSGLHVRRTQHALHAHIFAAHVCVVTTGKNVTSLACGEAHIVAATADGRVFAWGADDFGQAGANATNYWNGYGTRTAQPVTQLQFRGAGDGAKVVDVGAGFLHSYAITCTPK